MTTRKQLAARRAFVARFAGRRPKSSGRKVPSWVRVGASRAILATKRLSAKRFRTVTDGTHGKVVTDHFIKPGGFYESFGEHLSSFTSVKEALRKGPTQFGRKSNFQPPR